MALSVIGTLTFNATQVILTNTTGDYSVSNTTGYGTPNLEFTDYAHFAIIRKKNVNSVADVVLTLDAYDEETAESFTTDRDSDGWYEGILLDIPIWSAGSYADNDVVYSGASVYQANAATSGVPGVSADWDVVSDLTTIEDSASIESYTIGRSTPYDADVYWSKKIAQNSQRGRCGICEDDVQKERLDKIEFHINAVLIADQQGNNSEAEWNVLSLIALGAV